MAKDIDFQKVHQVGGLQLLARQVVEGFITGLHKSPLHGFSVEFAEHRIYNPGESTKHIDWKLYGRSEKLFVKRYEEETNLRCQIVLDCSSSMYYPIEESATNKITFSIYAAAAIVELLKKQRDAVGLSMFSDRMEVHIPAKSSIVHHRLLYAEMEKRLLQDQKEKKTSAVAALHQVADNINRRSLVIIFSDMMDNSEKQNELFAALQHLKHNKHEIILFHVVDKEKELDFNFENRPYRFVDTETGEEVKVHPNRVRQQYVDSMMAFTKELKLRCGQFKIDFVEADISEGFKQILQPYLLKRGKMY